VAVINSTKEHTYTMLRETARERERDRERERESGLVAFYDIWPGNG